MNRLIVTLIAAVLLAAFPANATYYTHVYDWLTLAQSGHAVSGASIYVYDHSDDGAATIFSDVNGETPSVQPIATDSDGLMAFLEKVNPPPFALDPLM